MGGEYGGAGDGEVSGSVRRSSDDESEDDAKKQERNENWREQIATSGLGKGRQRHLSKGNSELSQRGIFNQQKLYTKAL